MRIKQPPLFININISLMNAVLALVSRETRALRAWNYNNISERYVYTEYPVKINR